MDMTNKDLSDKDFVRLLVYRAAQHRMHAHLGYYHELRKASIITSTCLNCEEPVVDEKTREYEYLNTGICSHCQQAATSAISDDDVAKVVLAGAKCSVDNGPMDTILVELGNKMEKVLADRRPPED